MPNSQFLEQFDTILNTVAKEREAKNLGLNEMDQSRLQSGLGRLCDLKPFVVNLFWTLRAGNATANALAEQLAEQFQIEANKVLTTNSTTKTLKAGKSIAKEIRDAVPVVADPNDAKAGVAEPPTEPLAIATTVAAAVATPKPAAKKTAVTSAVDKPSDAVIEVLKEIKAACKNLNIDGRSLKVLPDLLTEAIKGHIAWTEAKPEIVKKLSSFTKASGGKPDPAAVALAAKLEI